jgi:protein-S-isoprenylcysteine O-methyltransferase Ste14
MGISTFALAAPDCSFAHPTNFSTSVILGWYRFVQIPFEERELLALFGDQYKNCQNKVPRLLPFIKREKHSDSDY